MTPRLLKVLLPTAALFFSISPQAQTTPTTVPRAVTLDERQQAALGIQTAPAQTASAAQLMASAFVTVPPGQEVVVTAPMGGTLLKLEAGLGDKVRQGAPLAVIASAQLADARRQSRELELELRNARATAERDQALLDEGVIPQSRLSLSQNRLAAAQAAWQSQAAALRASGLSAEDADYASGRIVSPRAGSVVEALAAVGQRVEAGTVLFRIADLRQLQLDLVLSGDKASRLHPGDAVTIASHGAQAILIGVGRSLDASQQAHARARVTQPGRLQAGETVQVQVLVQEQAQESAGTGAPAQRWQVPVGALLELQDKRWVVQVEASRLVPVPVELLSADGRSAVVQGALRPHQRVVSAGMAALRPLLLKGQ